MSNHVTEPLPGNTTRALFAIRLSDYKDSTTSPGRQLEHCRNLVSMRGWVHAGTAEDLDISATKYSPFDRPELGDWLNNRAHEFDVIVFWRFDRIARSSADLSDLIRYCRTNGKDIVSATEPFDTTDPFGEAMITIIVALAQLEARTTSLRVQDMHDSLKATDRLASGIPPFGFVPVPHPSGKGVTYQRDPEMRQVLHDMAGKLLEGWSLTGIARWLTKEGVLNARDRARIRKGQEPKHSAWETWLVKSCLESPATQGWKLTGGVQKGTPVLDDQGNRIRVADPTFDDATWEQIQEKLKERSDSGKRRTLSPNPLLGIGVCGGCGRGLSRQVTRVSRGKREYVYYRCNRQGPHRCKGVQIAAPKLERLLEAAFLTVEGNNRVR